MTGGVWVDNSILDLFEGQLTLERQRLATSEELRTGLVAACSQRDIEIRRLRTRLAQMEEINSELCDDVESLRAELKQLRANLADFRGKLLVKLENDT